MSRRPRRPLAIALAAVAFLVATTGVLAQDAPRRRLGIGWTADGRATLTFSVRDVADAGVRRKLESGLWQTLVLRVWARRGADDTQLAATARVCRVLYDVWSESWRVELQREGVRTEERVADLDGVVDRCLVARDLPIGAPEDWRALRGGTAYFAVLVELNPLSANTVRRIKRWLAQPGGGLDGGDAFFGSFVALFVNRRVEQAERALRFRSQEVVVE